MVDAGEEFLKYVKEYEYLEGAGGFKFFLVYLPNTIAVAYL